jgi:hypothetical protein
MYSLSHFLFTSLRLPLSVHTCNINVVTPHCEGRRGKETISHIVLSCQLREEDRRFLDLPIRNKQELPNTLSIPGRAKRLVQWILYTGKLPSIDWQSISKVYNIIDVSHMKKTIQRKVKRGRVTALAGFLVLDFDVLIIWTQACGWGSNLPSSAASCSGQGLNCSWWGSATTLCVAISGVDGCKSIYLSIRKADRSDW